MWCHFSPALTVRGSTRKYFGPTAGSREERFMSGKTIVVTGASSGFGRLAANALASAGHTVYASMRETKGRNAPQVADVEQFARDHRVDLRVIELDVNSQDSVDAGIAQIMK